VKAAIELRQLLRRRGAAGALCIGFARLKRQAGHMAFASLHQSLDGLAQAAAVEVG